MTPMATASPAVLPGRTHAPDAALHGPDAQRCPTAAVQPSDGAQLVRSDGTVVACCKDGLTLPVADADLAQARDGGGPRLRTVTIEDGDYRVLSVSWHHGGIVQVAHGFAEADTLLAGLRLRLGGLVAAAVLAAAAAGWWFAKQLVRPLEQLASPPSRWPRRRSHRSGPGRRTRRGRAASPSASPR